MGPDLEILQATATQPRENVARIERELAFAADESGATWRRVAAARDRRDRLALSAQNARVRLAEAEAQVARVEQRADMALLHGADGLRERFRAESAGISGNWPGSTPP